MFANTYNLFPRNTPLAADVLAAALPPFLFAWVHRDRRISWGFLLGAVAVLSLCLALVWLDLLNYWRMEKDIQEESGGWPPEGLLAAMWTGLWNEPGRPTLQEYARNFLRVMASTFLGSSFLTLAIVLVRHLASRSQTR
ncbi:MAG: hypothetical protein JO112_14035 [Planctomycetes bacterium]|nr:hypothetical protein [Planctomycetota bacterium]